MRTCIKNAITIDEAEALRSKSMYLSFEDPRLHNILGMVHGVCDASTDDPAYVRVETKPEGHPWHRDTGSAGHMSWCRYSARLLLNPESDFTGGGFYFRDEPHTPVYGYRDLWVYDSAPENEHYVASHKGHRSVLLMFLS